ncbi:MAG TPA: hypothetical protein PLL53_13865, partial [Saprospiraceae bacterium]|nr:hypothetical protein [Saprospiraceae bacterium]
MMRILLATILLFATATISHAQLPDLCPPNTIALSNTCALSCVLCDFTTFSSSNNTTTAGQQVPPTFCPGQAILPHNVQWIGFVAGSSNITMSITPVNCNLGNNNGLQVGIWGTTDCSSFSLVSNCVYQAPPNQATTLTMTGLTVGGTYFFVVDGHSNDVCQFTVNVTSGSTVAPPVTATPAINAPSGLYCPGGTYTFSSSTVANAGTYNWTLNGVNVGSDQTVTITLPPDPNATYNLCITPSNSCHGDGPQQCISIPVTPLPTEVLTENICPGQSVNIYGNSYSVPGNYP